MQTRILLNGVAGKTYPLLRSTRYPLCASAVLLLLPCGCFDPSSAPTTSGTGTDTDADTGVATDVDPTNTPSTDTADTRSGTTSPDPCEADQNVDPICSSQTPYCLEGVCVDCTELGASACGDISAATSVCDASSGLCVECSASDASACELRQVCVDNACASCTDGAQCDSGVCLEDEGLCLLLDVAVEGTVILYGNIDPTPQSDASVTVTNVDPAVATAPTAADGLYSFSGVAPSSLLDVEIDFAQDDPFFIPAAIRSRSSLRVGNDSPMTYNPAIVTYAWMSQVAFECGLFPTLEAAQGAIAVNPYYTQRSTVFGRLVDEQGDGVATIAQTAIQVELDGFANFHQSIVDVDTNPAAVCFLDADPKSGTYVGTTATVSNDTGRFVMFRVRDTNGFGQGPATVRVSGFADASVQLGSTGNVGVVELVRNGDAIVRDFAADVYPIFTTHGCIGCHFNGGPAAAVRAGFQADWSLTPTEVWQNMTGPGTECADLANPVRVCVNAPESSLFVTRPLNDAAGMLDAHPIDIFPTLEDPSLRVIIEWIEQGALPPTDVQFTDDIYPLFTKHGCVGCHTAGGPAGASSLDLSVAVADVYGNLIAPGTTCPDVANPLRVCTDNPAISKLVTFPLTDTPASIDNHPVDAFGTINDPDLQLILQWISQGAMFDVTCEHSECVPGLLLNQGCSDCAQSVCAADPFCCTNSWDGACVNGAEAIPACGC